jgi:hypothetical protein
MTSRGYVRSAAANHCAALQDHVGASERLASDRLDWLLIASARHLECALTVHIHHDNVHRAHRSVALAPPNSRPAIQPWWCAGPVDVKRRDRFGGLIHEYRRAA